MRLLLIVTVATLLLEPAVPRGVARADARADAVWGAYRATTAGSIDYSPPRCPPGSVSPQGTRWLIPGYPAIDAMRDSAQRTWQRMEVQFDGFVDSPSSFRPGAHYPEVYIRDVSTMLPALQYFYGAKQLEAGLGEFLGTQFDAEPGDPEDALWGSFQPGRGAITAIINTSALSKATIVSDEEISLIRAAYIYYHAAGGADWLRRSIRGKTTIQRLNAALEWIWSTRTDPAMGLVKRRHTTDWGDVAMEGGPVEGSLPVDANVWTASIYDQALAFQALRELASMNRAIGDDGHASRLDARAEALRVATQVALWLPDRGYYRTHIHTTPLVHPFDEDAIVSIANGIALYSGISEGLPEHLIVDNLERVRLQNGVGKPGLTLSPPYVSGLFGHPNMGAWSYQNGGVWDWWAGMQVTGEFQQGFSELAFQHLRQLAEDWKASDGEIWEWQHAHTRQNSGSPDYAGAAATATEAIIAGLFGIRFEPDLLWIGPRLGGRSGAIEVVQPSSGCWVSVNHLVTEREITITYASNKAGELRMSALLPDGAEVDRLRADGRPAEFTQIQRGQDRLVILSGLTPGRGQVNITLKR